MKFKFRKGTRVRPIGKKLEVGTVIHNFHEHLNWCVVRGEDQILKLRAEELLIKIPSYIHTSLDLAIFEDNERVVAAVAKMLAANSPYMDVLKGGVFPSGAATVIRGVK